MERCAGQSRSGCLSERHSATCIEIAGATSAEFGMFVSGIMMGTLSFNLDEVISLL
jgi:hypothetical protein